MHSSHSEIETAIDEERTGGTQAKITTENVMEDKSPSIAEENNRARMRAMVYLSVMYASDIGGTGVVTGTGPNLILIDTLAR